MMKEIKKYTGFKLGFTLAEVLITLGVIGVVAALTIPVLMNSYQNKQYATALAKAYSVTNSALTQLVVDSGCGNDLQCTQLLEENADTEPFGDALVKYMSIAKNCKRNANQHCFAPVTNLYFDGTSTSGNPTFDAYGWYEFITADGMSFAIRGNDTTYTDCGNQSMNSTGNMTKICGLIYIDVNGPKQPNVFGRDTFEFFITAGKGALLYPRGGADDGYHGNWVGDNWWKNGDRCNSTDKNGEYCTGRVMEEVWQMKY